MLWDRSFGDAKRYVFATDSVALQTVVKWVTQTYHCRIQTGDVVAVLLGLRHPIVLRPTTTADSSSAYRVVGLAYINGLGQSRGLLGPLPDGMTSFLDKSWKASNVIGFEDKDRKFLGYDDPRLGPLPKGWEFAKEYEAEDRNRRRFRKTETGSVTRKDPRLEVGELRQRGVGLEKITLV